MTDNITELLAAFTCGNPNLPDASRQMMRMSLLDWAACGLAGRHEPVSKIVRDQALADGGTPVSSVIGSKTRLAAKQAALVNGTTSHALDYDDTHFAHIGHPSVAVVSAALATAQEVGASGDAFLDAALVGAEVSVRVGVWLGRSHYQTGFHQTATAGAFGATAAACRLMKLSEDQTAHALGLVSTRASGLKSQFGTMGKPFNAGIAAANGVEAAQLARAGFVSDPTAVWGPQGFGPTHAGQGDMSAFADLNDALLFDGISHKFHACCHGTHAALEAIRGLDLQTSGNAVSGIEIRTHPRWMTVCNISEPETGLQAKFSYRMTAAMALGGLDTGALDSFSGENCVNPRLVALRDQVRVIADDSVSETATIVTIDLSSGEQVTADHDLNAPIDPVVRLAKLRAKAAAITGAETSENIWDALNHENGPDLDAFSALLTK